MFIAKLKTYRKMSLYNYGTDIARHCGSAQLHLSSFPLPNSLFPLIPRPDCTSS